MAQALGQLPNAPLIYVLAQIIFDRVPKMEDMWEDFHQRLFEVYPESEIEPVEQFTLIKESLETTKETRWHLLSRDRCKGLILRSNALIFHTTIYTTSKDFFNELEFALSNLINIIPPGVQASRLGLRYIDMLLPQNNVDVDNQVVEKLGMVSLDQIGCQPTRFERVANYKTQMGGELKFRHRQTTGTDVLPNDLFPNNLKPAPLLGTPKQEGSIVGLLDFDHFVKVKVPLETKSIIDTFNELHKTTSNAFREITTTGAMKLWKEVNND